MIRAASPLPLALLLALGGTAPAVAAQAVSPAPAPGRSWTAATAHYGKWLTGATAAAFTAMAAREHQRSDQHWDRLLVICRANNADCAVGPNGRYASAPAESLYQAAIHHDRRARRRLLAGQVALLVTAGLFVLDLRDEHGRPKDIPLEPELTAQGARVGVRVAF